MSFFTSSEDFFNVKKVENAFIINARIIIIRNPQLLKFVNEASVQNFTHRRFHNILRNRSAAPFLSQRINFCPKKLDLFFPMRRGKVARFFLTQNS
jgi:hypothetical protein